MAHPNIGCAAKTTSIAYYNRVGIYLNVTSFRQTKLKYRDMPEIRD